ncbi:MAG: phage capsid protein [Candidatus Hodarchaeales archaeon]
MSIYINNVAVTLFDPMVKQAYQAKGFKLKDTVRVKHTNGDARTVSFPKLGKGVATQKALQDDVTLANLNWTNQSVTLQDWNASDLSDIFGQANVNFDERQELSESLGMMIGRRSDQLIIDALNASGTSNVIAAGGTAFTYAKYLALNKYFAKNNINGNGMKRHIVMDYEGEQDVLNDDKFINSRFTEQQVLDNGGTIDGINMFGYTWHVFGDMDEGGLPVSSTTHKAFAYAENSVGFGLGMHFRTTVDWVPMKRSFLVSSDYKANAVAIDNVGIVEVSFVE